MLVMNFCIFAVVFFVVEPTLVQVSAIPIHHMGALLQSKGRIAQHANTYVCTLKGIIYMLI